MSTAFQYFKVACYDLHSSLVN